MRFDSLRADRLTAVILFALGAAMLYGGYTMDRLEIRRIHPASIPGLVPMLLGAALAVCAAALFLSARPQDDPAAPLSWRSIGIALALCLVYALGLIGNVPFFWATAAFVGVFAGIFAWRDTDADARRGAARAMIFSAAFGLIVAGFVAALFRYGFLVRLP
jgi:Tripartite tricarboxylate transporter TctB family